VSPDSNHIQLSASSRGIVDYFFCFTCDEYVWDCDHLIEERLTAAQFPALERSELQSFAYDGRLRILEIEFRVMAPYTYGEIPLPPPPHVIQYREVPRYIFTRLMRFKSARRQELFWQDTIRRRFKSETVRTLCRLPRERRLTEARNIHSFEVEDYTSRVPQEEHESLQHLVAAMKILLLQVLAPSGPQALAA
jgi:hypothetical protein